MRAILIHGMGRSPLAMLVLAARLRAAGIRPHLFGYMAIFHDFESCRQRLAVYIARHAAAEPYIIVGHSLGGVLARAALPLLRQEPSAIFLLAVPACACRAARYFAPRRWFRWLTGTMVRRLADEDFMQSLPIPTMVTRIYAGTNGPRGRWVPLGDELNDGVVTVAETRLPGISVQNVPCVHSSIMNSKTIATDIICTTSTVAGV